MAAVMPRLRGDLSAPGLIRLLRDAFHEVPDPRRAASVEHALPDALGAALAMFHLKSPSMLDFDTRARSDPHLIHNLKHLYRLDSVPSDTQMREILDQIAPEALRGAFQTLHHALQRGRALEDFVGIGGRYVLAIDGTGTFCSTAVNCPHCLIKKRAKGGVTEYAHQAVVAAIVHPDKSGQALVVDVEPITRADGATKNDCERNATARLLDSLNTAYPARRWLVVQDALAANGPHLTALLERGMDYIVGVKPGNSAVLERELDRRFEAGEFTECGEHADPNDGCVRGYRFINQVPLNGSHPDLLVNHLEAWETNKRGKTTVFTWLTSLAITMENAAEIARTARSRWRIENELFNVIKNQGYEYGRNYGHGKRYLASTLGMVTMLAFLIDQILEQACRVFQQARKRMRTKRTLWEQMRALMRQFYLDDWQAMLGLIIDPDAVRLTAQPRDG